MTGKTPDLASLIFASSKNFNRARDYLRSKGRDRPPLRGIEITTRNLQSYDLNGIYFFRCRFEDVKFGNLKSVNFNNCFFSNCTFSPDLKNISAGQEPMIHDVIFFKCSFDGGSFERQTLRDVQFAELELAHIPSFKAALIDGYFIYEDKKANREFLVALSEADTSSEALVQIIGAVKVPFLTWEKVRFVGKLPFLQISLVGVTTLAVFAAIISSVGDVQSSLKFDCLEVAERLYSINDELVALCSRVASALPTNEILSNLRNTFIGLLAIFAGSLLQAIRCPEEVAEFSRARWVRQLRRPKEFYLALSTKHQVAIWIATALQGIGVGFFAYKSIKAFLTPFL